LVGITFKGVPAGLRPRLLRWLPLLAAAALGALWFVAFHYRVHEGSATGPQAILEANPDLLRFSALAFLIAFTIGSAAIWMPCIMQMVLVFSGVQTGTAGRFRGGWFFSGYIATYAALGLAAAAFGEAFGRLHLVGALQIVGGAAIAFIGLYLLGVLRSRLLQPCGSALGFALKGGRLHRLGRFPSGVAFATYCAGCCGPLLYPLFLFAAASGSLLIGAAVAAGFALAMAMPIGILGSLGRRSLSLVGPVVNNYDAISRAAGVALVTFGTLLVLNRPLISFIDAVHQIEGRLLG
jgi:cytochrome c biogenesis protein CcdA